MRPKTLSASSLQVATGCPRRYHAENILRTPDRDNNAALVGTAVHGALEEFVKAFKFDQSCRWEFKTLEMFYIVSFRDTFGTADRDSAEYIDGLDLLMRWFKRNEELKTIEVISCEVKSTFPVATSIGEIPCTYIWDRCDRIDAETIRVVDYKTLRGYIRPEELREKIQPRLYGLAAQFQFPEAKQIWVQFEMLRFEPIQMVFNVEDNRKMYYYIQAEAERIISIPDETEAEIEEIPERLNLECGYCVRKSVCATLNKHTDGGGILGLSPEQLVEKREAVANQLKALRILDEQLDELIVKEAEQRNEFDWQSGDYQVNITARKSRKLENVSAAAKIIGPDLLQRYGNITLASMDKLLKSGELDDQRAAQLKSLIKTDWSEPKSKVTKKKGL